MPSSMAVPSGCDAVEPFVNRDDVAQIIMAIAAEDREMFERRYRASVAFMNIKVIDGGAERTDTVARALEFVDPECDFIADPRRRPAVPEPRPGRRRLSRPPSIHGAALLAVPVADTIKRAGDDRLTTGTVPREHLYLAQTPQVFRRDLLLKAYAAAFARRRERSPTTASSSRPWDRAARSSTARHSISRSPRMPI